MALVGDFSGGSSIGGATTLTSPGDHATKLAAGTYSGADRTNMQSDTKVFTLGSAPAANVDGELTLNTTDITDGPTLRAQMYDATAGVHIDFAEAIYSATTPASGFNIPGLLWRDTTLHLWRRYESATTAPNKVAGWHPVDAAYQLWKNEKTAFPVDAGYVVCAYPIGTNNLRTFGSTETAKDQSVVGVAMEGVAVGAYGVIAMVAGGATVDVLCDDGEADGAVAKGDFLCTYSEEGEARTAGPQTANAIVAAGNHTVGAPMGAFAVALGTKDAGTHLVKAKLLGFVGTGAMAFLKRVKIVSDTTPNTANTEIDASKIASGTAGAQGTQTAAISNKHLPFAAAQIEAVYDATMAAGGSSAQVSFFSDGGTTANAALRLVGEGAGQAIGGTLGAGHVPTHAAGATTTKGNVFSYKYLESNISAVAGLEFYLTGYIY